MTESPKTSPDGFEIKVSPDRMSVTLEIAQGATASASDVITKLRDMKITRFDDGMVIEAIDKRKGEALSVEVATGVAPVDDRPERIEYRVPVTNGLSCLPTKVEVGQMIATMTPAVVGTDGHDVFGQPIERHKNPPSVKIGRNLQAGKGRIVCELRGNLRLSENVLSVEPLLEIRGDTGSLAPIIFDGDAVIRGSLTEGRILQISGCLTVGGAIEAVQLRTGGAVHLQGGMVGKQKGKFVIGGELQCRFISGGFIVTGRDVHVQSDIIDTRLACGGKLTVDQGVIFGGVVAANAGIACQTLGHAGGTPTLIEAGEGVVRRSLLATSCIQIEANQKRIRSVRATIEPLVKMMKSLTPQQREKVTELLYEADELEVATKKLMADMEHQTIELNANARPEVLVEKIVHPGVTVRFPHVKTTFTTAFRGPFTLSPHKSGGVTEIVLIDGTDQSRTVLPSHPVDLAVEPKFLQMTEAQAA